MSAQRCTVSACLIARDEEAFIQSCLASLHGAVDEIVVVDTGSADRTPEIARALGAQVIVKTWPGDFSLARNWSLEAASGDWALVIDADEELLPESAELVKSYARSGAADAYLINIHHFPDDEEAHLVSQRVGLFRRDPRFRYEGRIHEQVGDALRRNGGKVSASLISVVHRGYEPWVIAAKRKHLRNLTLLQYEMELAPLEARWYYYVGQEYQALSRFAEAAEHFERCLELVQDKSQSSLVVPTVLRLLLCYARMGDWDRFYETSDRYRSAFPACTDIRFIDARASAALGNLRRGLAMLMEAISAGDPPPGMFHAVLPGTGSYRAWFTMGQILEHMGQKREAVGAYIQALQAKPTYRAAAGALTRLLLTADPPEAVVAFVLECIASRHPATLVAVSDALLEQGAHASALDVLDQIGEEWAAERALRRAIVQSSLGDMEAARVSLTLAAHDEQVKDNAALDGVLAALELGDRDLAGRFVRRLHPGRFSSAIKVLAGIGVGDGRVASDGVAWAGGGAEVLTPQELLAAAWQLVQRALAMGQYKAVDRLVDFIVKQGTPKAQAQVALGKLLFAVGKKPLAWEMLLRGAQDGAELDAESAALLAQAALERDDWDGAEELLRYAAELDRRDHRVAAAMAALLVERGRLEEAVQFLDERIAANPWAQRLKDQRDALARRLAAGRTGA